jgi:hypothetical protein
VKGMCDVVVGVVKEMEIWYLYEKRNRMKNY